QAAAPRVPVRPPTRVTATALETYCRCPAEFWWRHVVGLDDSEAARAPADMTPSPREMGLACHRALELAASGDEAAIRTAVDAALRELPSVARAALGEIRRDVAAKVALVWTSPLGQRVARAKRVYREMPLLLEVGETEIAGKADLIFQNTDGEWELVDYKSRANRPADERNADAYRLQLSLYAMAAERWLGRPVARWSVCFLDSAAVAEQSVTSEMLRAAEAEAKQALADIANGRFQPSNQEACRTCRLRRLCGR
ncbi:MAG: PD-(D/E)XK nuclease family protein, partial [Phycisphaerae bacterium]